MPSQVVRPVRTRMAPHRGKSGFCWWCTPRAYTDGSKFMDGEALKSEYAPCVHGWLETLTPGEPCEEVRPVRTRMASVLFC